jgi:hypothetical protein
MPQSTKPVGSFQNRIVNFWIILRLYHTHTLCLVNVVRYPYHSYL